MHWKLSKLPRGFGWTGVAAIMAVVVASPQIALLYVAVEGGGYEMLRDLWRTSLPVYLEQTTLLLGLTLLVAFVLGAPTAWLTAQYQFRGAQIFRRLLILPLAVPGYIAAYAYTEFFGDAGIASRWLVSCCGFEPTRSFFFNDIRSLPGAALVLGCVLYPYVYLSTRAAFAQYVGSTFDVARSLGATSTGVFFRVALPLARPALVAGLALVAMETLHDLGAVEYFGVQTLTHGVYIAWLHQGSLPMAATLGALLLLPVVLFLVLEQVARQRRSYAAAGSQRPQQPHRLQTLTGWRGFLATTACVIPIFLGLMLPVFVLLEGLIQRIRHEHRDTLMTLVDPFVIPLWNTIWISFASAAILLFVGLLMAHAVRLASNGPMIAMTRLASTGYALPGVVLAFGLFMVLRWIEGGVQHLTGQPTLVLSGTVFGLIAAYTVRFVSVTFGTIESGYQRMARSTDDAAKTLGAVFRRILFFVHLPLLRPTLAAGCMLVIVDCVKELPMTLLMRPFGFDTLATQTYTYASLGRFDVAALPALAIIVVGLASLWMIDGLLQKERTQA